MILFMSVWFMRILRNPHKSCIIWQSNSSSLIFFLFYTSICWVCHIVVLHTIVDICHTSYFYQDINFLINSFEAKLRKRLFGKIWIIHPMNWRTSSCRRPSPKEKGVCYNPLKYIWALSNCLTFARLMTSFEPWRNATNVHVQFPIYYRSK